MSSQNTVGYMTDAILTFQHLCSFAPLCGKVRRDSKRSQGKSVANNAAQIVYPEAKGLLDVCRCHHSSVNLVKNDWKRCVTISYLDAYGLE